MRIQRFNFKKEVKMHLACSKDELRPAMNCIYFKNGYAYASDGHILVRNKIDEICTTIGIDNLDGKLLSAKSYSEILKYNHITITDEGILVGRDRDLLYKFKTFDYKYPNADAVLKSAIESPSIPINKICLNIGYLHTLSHALYGYDTCVLQFKGEERNVLLNSVDKESIGLIMPKRMPEDINN